MTLILSPDLILSAAFEFLTGERVSRVVHIPEQQRVYVVQWTEYTDTDTVNRVHLIAIDRPMVTSRGTYLVGFYEADDLLIVADL